MIKKLFYSGVSMRRAARILNINRKTAVRKHKFLGTQGRINIGKYLKGKVFNEIQFDEMETFEHTKCKPLSIPIIVDANSRKVLGFAVASMPATGHLAKIARKKYGYRPDHRKKVLNQLLKEVKPYVAEDLKISTDQKTLYPPLVKKHFPGSVHYKYKGRRGCIVGQGELKKIGFDPIFSLNHTAAMFRANINRLFRRTWCTTKKPSSLLDHIAIYVEYHNKIVTA